MSELVIETRDSRLTPRQTQQIVDHLTFTWKLAGCSLCKGTRFDVIAIVVLRAVPDLKTLLDNSGAKRPCATLTCLTCGDVRILDLTVAGVFDVPAEDAPSAGPYR